MQLAPGPTTTVGWVVPVDDTHHRRFHSMKVPKNLKGRPRQMYTETRPKPWIDMTEEERQRAPSDWEAQELQGPITLHSEEHLATSDKGIAMVRRLLRQQIRLVQEGGDPIGVTFDPAKALMKTGRQLPSRCGGSARMTLEEFLRAIPKMELHCHLYGAVRKETFARYGRHKAPLTAAQIDEYYTRPRKPGRPTTCCGRSTSTGEGTGRSLPDRARISGGRGAHTGALRGVLLESDRDRAVRNSVRAAQGAIVRAIRDAEVQLG